MGVDSGSSKDLHRVHCVFGKALGMMQMHLTILLMMVVILATSRFKSWGGGSMELLHALDMLSLVVVWIVLWAVASSSLFLFAGLRTTREWAALTILFGEALSIIVGLFAALFFVAWCLLYSGFTWCRIKGRH